VEITYQWACIMRVFLCILAVLFVGACAYDPSYFPQGYAKSQEKYKSPDGPEPRDLGYEYSTAENQQILLMWEDAAVELVDAAEARGVVRGENVYIAPVERENAFYLTFDHVVRQELRARGYNLLEGPGRVTPLYLHAQLVNKAMIERRQKSFQSVLPAEAFDDVELGLSLGRGENQRASVTQMHVLPVYGFEDYKIPAYGLFSRSIDERGN